MVGHFEGHESFIRVEGNALEDEEGEVGKCVATMKIETEEGKKVDRNKGEKFVAVFRRVDDPAWPGET
jgi:tRNA (guanine-N7-)-methyltransferase